MGWNLFLLYRRAGYTTLLGTIEEYILGSPRPILFIWAYTIKKGYNTIFVRWLASTVPQDDRPPFHRVVRMDITRGNCVNDAETVDKIILETVISTVDKLLKQVRTCLTINPRAVFNPRAVYMISWMWIQFMERHRVYSPLQQWRIRLTIPKLWNAF